MIKANRCKICKKIIRADNKSKLCSYHYAAYLQKLRRDKKKKILFKRILQEATSFKQPLSLQKDIRDIFPPEYIE